MAQVVGTSDQPGVAGVTGQSSEFNGVLGETTADGHAGVAGVSDSGVGNGVYGRSQNANGVYGHSYADGHSGVAGLSEVGAGAGVTGMSSRGVGVQGISDGLNGVLGVSRAVDHAAVAGVHESGGIAVYGRSRIAGFFEGDVQVTGDIQLNNADCAEEFDIRGDDFVGLGTVMVLGDDGTLQPSEKPYDKRVAGVISGAGDLKPAIVLDKHESEGNRQPIALLGKVYCQVDADYAPVDVGDLLTTSSTRGHAMRADNPTLAFGAVIGKALEALPNGRGLVPILVALQ